MNVLQFKRYVDWKVYSVMKIKYKYGFRIYLFFSDGSKTIQQKSGFKSITEANKERNKVIGQLYNGTYVFKHKVKLKIFLEQWLEEKRKLISYNSYVAFKNVVNAYINPIIGKMYVSDLKKYHVEKLFKELESKSVSIIKNVKSVLNISLDYAKEKQLINNNPSKEYKLPKKLVSKFDKENVEKNKVLNINQIKKLIDASKESKIYMQILFATLMGLRRGEINGLKYSDIDFINQKLKIQRQLGVIPNSNIEDFDKKTYTKQEIRLKTPSSYRELDIPDYVFEEILKERKIYETNRNRRKKSFQDLNYICCSSYGRPRSKSYHFIHFKNLLKENNLPDIRFHDLRKSYSTMLFKNNFDVKTISRLLGHSSEIITLNSYTNKHLLIEDCLEEIEGVIEKITRDCINLNNNIKDYTDINIDKILENTALKLEI